MEIPRSDAASPTVRKAVGRPTSDGIRTYKARQGRISARTREGLAAGEGLLLDPGRPFDAAAVFGDVGTVALEIGPGFGEATIAAAVADPSTAIVAAEVHTRGVSRLLRALVDARLTNVRVLHGDAVGYLRSQVSPSTFTEVRCYFPDPWPKARHAKRRLIRPDVLDLLAERVRPDGLLRVATDWAPYADDVRTLLRDHRAWEPLPDGRADRPTTRYEEIARRSGRRIEDLVARRLGD